MSNTVPAYATSPAARLLATHCLCCGRPLIDADSVEAGVGPDCRETYGYGLRQGAPDWAAFDAALTGTAAALEVHEQLCDPRTVANWLVWRIATHRDAPAARAYCRAVWALGYHHLAGKIATRLGAVVVTRKGDELVVRARFLATFAPALRLAGCPSRWDDATKTRRVPASARLALWRAIGTAYGRGTLVVGERGISLA